MASLEDKEIQLACLSFLYEAVNETCRAGAGVTYSSSAADHEEHLSDTEIFLCKLAKICDSKKGGDTITALACLKDNDRLEYILCSNARHGPDLEACAVFLTDLLNYIIMNPDKLQDKALRKQVLWRVLKFNIGRVGFYLKALNATIADCIDDCDRLGEEQQSPALQHLLAIKRRCGFPIDMKSTDNSESYFLRSCESLINIIQDVKDKGLARILDVCANIPGNDHWSQLRHLLGRLHSYRQAVETITGAARRRPDLFRHFTVVYVSSAGLSRSLVPRDAPLQRLVRTAFPDPRRAAACESDIAELESGGLHEALARLQHRHRNKTTVHCEVLLHGYLAEQGQTAPLQFLDDGCFIATSKPPCKLCHVYFSALEGHFRVRAPHLNMYSKWRLPDSGEDDAAERDEILDDMIEQMQDDTVALLRDKRALWRRHDSRTDTHAGFQSALAGGGGGGGGMMTGSERGGGGGVSVRSDSAMSMRSHTVTEMPPPRHMQPMSSAASASGSWGGLG